jgi:type II secretory pathway pseudopilin PulG
MRFSSGAFHHGQHGAALLAFMLILIVTAASMLMSRLNEHAQTWARDQQTQLALAEAKRALLNYAMNYPELRDNEEKGPGFLPCPDQNNDGNPTSCGTTATTFMRLGRLPFRILGLSDLRDSSGERLWYAVSDNFKNTLSNETILNSETPGLISVDGTDDIVAVIIAPGGPLGTQTARPSTAAADYLEGSNEIATDGTFVTAFSGEFNDRIETITRAELMERVEQRVISDARAALAGYVGTNGAYPWLATFADPKSGARWLKGEHSGSDNSASLQNSSADFVSWGVSSGDRIWNLTDGSSGTVSVVAATSLTVTGLGFGTDNDFDTDDEYFVEIRALSGAFRGTATTGSSGLTLRDSSKDFEQLDVVPGDVVDMTNGSSWTTARSSGLIESVDGDQIVVTVLSGTADNSFASGDEYRIRSNRGRATASLGLILEDTAADFTTMGVQAGDVVHNLTDGSVGTVASVATDQLTLGALSLGTDNAFDANDYYAITRFSAATGTREGLLPVHEPGALIPSGFSFDWSILTANANTLVPDALGSDTTYQTGLYNWVQSSSSNSGTVTVATADTRCRWLAARIADCHGEAENNRFLSGTVTSSGATTLSDSTKSFVNAGIKRGDRVFNTADGTEGIVYSATATQLTVSNITGWSSLNKASGQPYRVRPATDVTNGTAQWPTSCTGGVYWLYTWSGGFVGSVEIGDVVQNTNFSSVGRVTAVGYNGTYNRDYVRFTALTNGAYDDFCAGEGYRIHSNHVDRRVFRFDIRFGGDVVAASASGLRTRTVCHGYGTNCTTGPGDALLVGDGSTSVVTILDYDEDDILRGQAAIQIPASPSAPLSSLRVSGLNYQLDDTLDADGDGWADELPGWFVKNRWHQLLHAGYSAAFAPGAAAGGCPTSGACLQLQTPLSTFTDRESMVVAAGMPLDAEQAALRANASMAGYYEDTNSTGGDNIYAKNLVSGTFNDQLSVVCPDPNNPSCP